MLDTTTKRRIDDCRDILVGKLPDPKAQIEQITIALIYKFMDDMDKEAIELGGKAKFFSGDYSKYSWDALFSTKVTSAEMLRLYSEAIESMEKNPSIPQLFRDIFDNAYLPYRDPETLKLFLKTIGGFEYTHSEKLGDAFEYLLSVMGSQGDAGQFRTPRHIIDFLVELVDPKKTDTILDPACGTAGFLISAFKHIKEQNKNQLTPNDHKKLIQNLVGYDISPDMVRLSLVNLYLHGFSDPHITEYDTLSSEERWDERFDVILANPPFMTPKGGIRPHKKFTIKSNRSEVLFVDYIAEHLNPNGRAGIIVPEGVIFQSGTAYKELRKMLVSNYLYAVVSLPAGVFNPYSGVKTSILLMDKALAKKTDNILFVKIDNDGYSLGTQRTAVKGSQLVDAVAALQAFRNSVHEQGTFENTEIAHSVTKAKVAESGDFNLSGERYKSVTLGESAFELLELQDLFDINRGGSPRPIDDYFTEDADGINWIKIGDVNEGEKYIISTKQKIKPEGVKRSRLVEPGDFILSNSMSFGRPYIVKITGCIHDGWLVFKQKANNINKDYIYHILSSEFVKAQFQQSATGGVVKNLNIDLVKKVKIPLPPLPLQEEIVAEIEGYQRIIDGAKIVVENYKPQIDIKPEWETVELGKYVSIQTGGTPSTSNESFWGGEIPWVSPKDMKFDFIGDSKDHITQEAVDNSSTKLVPEDTVLIVVRSGILQHTLPVGITTRSVSFNQDIIAINPVDDTIIPKYLFYYLKSTSKIHLKEGIKPGVTVQSFHNGYFKKLNIPIPSLDVQQSIVAQIDEEQELVNANKQLIQIFEQKIKDRIAKVWGEEKTAVEASVEEEEHQAVLV